MSTVSSVGEGYTCDNGAGTAAAAASEFSATATCSLFDKVEDRSAASEVFVGGLADVVTLSQPAVLLPFGATALTSSFDVAGVESAASP